MYFNSQFFPQMGGMMAAHPGMQGSMGSMHSMNMLYMDSLNRQDQGSSGTGSELWFCISKEQK
jgi:hypothetical protein